jgi:hypothetical protein
LGFEISIPPAGYLTIELDFARKRASSDEVLIAGNMPRASIAIFPINTNNFVQQLKK